MNKRKLISILLSFSLVMPAVAGCKNTEQPTTATDMSTPPTSVVVEPDDDIVPYEESLKITNNEMYDGERAEPPIDTLYATIDGVEIWGQGKLDYNVQPEGTLIRTFIAKNTNDEPVELFMYSPEESDIAGELNKVTGYQYALHPNGWNGHIEAGEEYMLHYDLSIVNVVGNEHLEGDLDISMTMQVTRGDNVPVKESFVLSQSFIFYSRNEYANANMRQGKITGVIKDEKGNPIEGAVVRGVCNYSISNEYALTDSNGEFSLKVSAFKKTYDNGWKECCLSVIKDGYNSRSIIVYPKTDKAVTVEMNLYPQNQLLKYEDNGMVDLELQGYEYDTDNSSIAVFVPFHTGLQSSELEGRIKLTAVDFDGNKLFDYPLQGQLPYVQVSKDGQYVVTIQNSGDDYNNSDGWRTVILDRTGKEVYSIDHYPTEQVPNGYTDEEANKTISRCANISNDNKYLVASSCRGYFYVIDWQNDKVVWQDYIYGQVRTIDFSDDNQFIYVSSGDGYYRCYTMEGKLVWKTFVNTWVTKVHLTDDSIVMTTKCAADTLKVLDRATGEIRWTYPTLQASLAIAVSPDGKYLWYGGHSSSGYSVICDSVFDMYTGEIVYSLGFRNAVSGAFSGDGTKLVVSDRKTLFVYNAADGSYLWSKDITATDDQSFSFSLCVNYDASKIIVAKNTDPTEFFRGQAYFFEYAGPDDNPEKNPNNIDRHENPNLDALFPREPQDNNNSGPGNTPDLPYGGPRDENGNPLKNDELRDAMISNTDYILTENTWVDVTGVAITDDFYIYCENYTLHLEGEITADGGRLIIVNSVGVDMSRLTFKAGENIGDGDLVIEVEGTVPVSYPNGVGENAPGPGKNYYYMHKSDRYQIFYAVE